MSKTIRHDATGEQEYAIRYRIGPDHGWDYQDGLSPADARRRWQRVHPHARVLGTPVLAGTGEGV